MHTNISITISDELNMKIMFIIAETHEKRSKIISDLIKKGLAYNELLKVNEKNMKYITELESNNKHLERLLAKQTTSTDQQEL